MLQPFASHVYLRRNIVLAAGWFASPPAHLGGDATRYANLLFGTVRQVVAYRSDMQRNARIEAVRTILPAASRRLIAQLLTAIARLQ
jgi:hypothetical protein